VSDPELARIRRQELERRIEAIEASDEEEFGRFTALDWAACIAMALVLPLLAVWWYAG